MNNLVGQINNFFFERHIILKQNWLENALDYLRVVKVSISGKILIIDFLEVMLCFCF